MTPTSMGSTWGTNSIETTNANLMYPSFVQDQSASNHSPEASAHYNDGLEVFMNYNHSLEDMDHASVYYILHDGVSCTMSHPRRIVFLDNNANSNLG